MPDDMLQRVCETIQRFLAIGIEGFEAEGALFVRGRSTPTRYDANHVGLVRAATEPEIEALLRRADVEYAHLQFRRFDLDPLTPPRLAARLALEGYVSSEGLTSVLAGPLLADPPAIEIREVLADDDWRTYGELAWLNVLEWTERHGTAPPSDVESSERLAYNRGKSPDVRTWMTYAGGTACGFVSSWPGIGGVGQVEDLFVRPDHRHRGIATALLAHCVADARARGAEAVVINSDIDDTPKLMYAAMGFRPFLVNKTYVKVVS